MPPSHSEPRSPQAQNVTATLHGHGDRGPQTLRGWPVPGQHITRPHPAAQGVTLAGTAGRAVGGSGGAQSLPRAWAPQPTGGLVATTPPTSGSPVQGLLPSPHRPCPSHSCRVSVLAAPSRAGSCPAGGAGDVFPVRCPRSAGPRANPAWSTAPAPGPGCGAGAASRADGTQGPAGRHGEAWDTGRGGGCPGSLSCANTVPSPSPRAVNGPYF